MIDMRFHLPASDLRRLVSSYYILDFDVPVFTDILQAEQANVRFAVKGRYDISITGTATKGVYTGAMFFGPRSQPLVMRAEGPGRVFGVGLLPMGLEALARVSAHEVINVIEPMDAIAGSLAETTMEMMSAADGDGQVCEIANYFFRAVAERTTRRAGGFQNSVERWLTDADDPQVDTLVALCDVSARQVERLTRAYFGISPKFLARKSRALRAAAKLRLNPQLGWTDVAGPGFYDQSHFIREFRAFTGMTPTHFAAVKSPAMGQSLKKRNEQRLISPLSLLT
ncbi:MAG: AraC family transcriptional regulator [Pacificimonas sp.]